MNHPSPLPASGQQLLVSETFVSLQGEGVSAGAPAAFLRLGNCNLTCGYCDTPYTWDEARYDLGSELSARDISSVARWVVENAPGRLVITGGEPLLQQKKIVALLKDVDARIRGAKGAHLVVEVETNGTVRPSVELCSRVDQWNVSPKLANSGVPSASRIRHDVLAALRDAGAFFKFVVTSPDDVDEVAGLERHLSLSPANVLLMPEAEGVGRLRERGPLVADWAQARSYRYSGRLHLELFGGRRGA